ncbi:MAG TPA: hypothetical protein VEW65_05205 [Chryseolinea sp.]|jgi:hypothetical protein|nr:hypothetical protein [Chryseolinea sp.]HZB14386.1 hypothetical protein [Chryseolinea sp.]
MKKLMFASLALLGSVALANAQEATPPQESTQATEAPAPAPAPEAVAPAAADQEDKTKIKSEELPEAVKKSLEAQEYRGWLIDAAYHVKSTDSYEVELKNGAETKTVKFDKEGKVQG